MKNKGQISDSWADEITKETEHYFQGEIQQDQRASWLLATSSALLTLLIGLRVSAAERGVELPLVLFGFTAVAYLLSAVISIFVIVPMRGTRSSWTDLWGKNYRKYKKMKIDQLIKERFRHDDKWSEESLEARLKYHFRSHYIRNSKKSYGIMWSSLLLVIGFVCSVLLIIVQY